MQVIAGSPVAVTILTILTLTWPQTWTPRELRHSFVSLLSSSGVPIEDISHLVGHSSTVVTKKVYRKELRPVLTRGARAMNALFDEQRAR